MTDDKLEDQGKILLLRTDCLLDLPEKKTVQQDIFFKSNDLSTLKYPSALLKVSCLTSWRIIQQPFLTSRHKQECSQLCYDRIVWTIISWKKVLWSDDSSFCMLFMPKLEYDMLGQLPINSTFGITLLVGLRIHGCILYTGVRPTTLKEVSLGMTLNCIWWWGPNSKAQRSV